MIRFGASLAALLFASVASAGPGLPLGMPPAEENPVMAKIAPEECIAYLSWAGSAAPDPESTNRTESLLAEPEVQQFVDSLEKLVTDIFVKEASRAGPGAEKIARLTKTWARTLLSRPGAAYLGKLEIGARGFEINAGLVVDLGDEADKFKATVTAELVKMLKDFEIPLEISEEDGFAMVTVRLEEGAPPITFGVKDTLLIAAVGKDAAKGIIERRTTDPPTWLTGLRKQLPVQRPSMVAYADAQKIIKTATMLMLRGEPGDELQMFLQATGLKSLATVSAVSGFGQQDFVTRVRLRFDGKPSGLLSTADAKPLTAEDLLPIPHDATLAIAARLDVGTTLDAVLTALAKQKPDLPDEIEKQLEAMSKSAGFHLRKDLIDALGDVWCLYHSAGEGGYLLGFAGVVKVRDREKLAAIEKRLVEQARTSEKELDRLSRNSRPHNLPKLNDLSWQGHKIYSLSGLGRMPLAPSWCLTDSELIIAPLPQIIKAYLARGDDFQSLATQPRVAELLKGEPVELLYQDTPRLFRLAYPLSQFAVRMMSAELARDEIDVDVSLLPSGSSIAKHLTSDSIAVSSTDDGFEVAVHESLPGFARAFPLTLAAASFVWMVESREGRNLAEAISMLVSPDAANEAIAKNRLKQILVAMHNYHDVHKRLPPAFSADKDGKPMLSWRVQILPYLEQEHLYDRFRLDEPWDSEHNKKLIPLMPDVFASPGSKAGAGKTNFLTIRHVDSAFPGSKGLPMREFTDGMSNTVAVVEAHDRSAVSWTKPDDFEINDMTRAASLTGLRKGGILAALVDGSVQKVKPDLDEETFGQLWNRHDGLAFDWGDVFIGNRRGRAIVRSRAYTDELKEVSIPRDVDVEVDRGIDGGDKREEPKRDDFSEDPKDEGAKP